MMETESTLGLAPLASPLPPVQLHDTFTPQQWATLLSICEVFVPSITSSGDGGKEGLISAAEFTALTALLEQYVPENESTDLVASYLAESATSNPQFKISLQRRFNLFVPPSAARGLGFILSALDTRLGSLLLTGSATPIRDQDLATRTWMVCSWSRARLPPLRAVFRSLAGLAKQTWLRLSPTLPRMLDFPAVPKHIERNDSFDFTFHDFSDTSAPPVLSTDVIIVGSGCGAGVVASHLSRAGLKCLILEKSYHFPSTHFPMSGSAAGEHLMENGGTVLSEDGSTVILAGSTLGGGGTINWSASLQPPHAVREEWAAGGLRHFESADFQDCLDTVCDRMGVAKSTDPVALARIEHNFANRTLLEGARRLGMAVEIVPQNTAWKRHFCGYCNSGCASTTKQGPANCWFPDAAAHGAEFVEGCFVDEILFSDMGSTRKAIGVKATWTSRDRQVTRSLVIYSKKVVIAAGALNSPLLLLRSGLTNPHIGSHLHLHPTFAVWSTWAERVDPWEGSILTTAVTAIENQDGHHHGPKVEVVCSTPEFGLIFFPFRPDLSISSQASGGGRGERTNKNSILSSAIDFKVSAAKFGHSTGFISIQRDADTGRVFIDPDDPLRRRVRVAYTLSHRDSRGLLAGQLAAARIAYAMGAREIDVAHPYGERFVRSRRASPETNDASFALWLAAVEKQGFTSPDPCSVGSAHQMGTCRMSASAATGVVDPSGRVWQTQDLYVADSSVFPNASGVNPMVTTMGIAEWVCRGIVGEWKREAD